MTEKIIGIDLGTTNSCVAVIENGTPVVIPNSEGYKTTPSIVAFSGEGDRLIGQLAKRQAVMNPERTIESVKRLMGSKHKLTVDHRMYSPEQISALILQKLKKQAQDYLSERVNKAIITVPAYFDDAQRLATRDAGQIAGLQVVRMINEPTACALTYGLHKGAAKQNVVVFDFGGGTFDVTVLEISEGVLHVRATNGNNQLGGYDFDQRIAQWIAQEIMRKHNVDVLGNAVALQRLRESAENAKIELSSASSTMIQLPFLCNNTDGTPINFEAKLDRDLFNQMTADLVASARHPVEQALLDAKIAPHEVNAIVLAGGTTRVPSVHSLINTMFNKDPLRAVNPDEAVAMGAAIQGGILTGEVTDIMLLDVVPMSIGIETGTGKVANVFKRNTTIPTTKKLTVANDSNRQTAIRVHFVQGEKEQASENKSLARLQIPLPDLIEAGQAQFEITFAVDVDGIFSCETLDKATNAKLNLELLRTHGLSRDELRQLADEAARQSEAEQKAVEQNRAAQQAQCVIGEADRVLDKYLTQADQSAQTQIKQTMSALRNAVLECNVQEINSKTKQLQDQIEGLVRQGAARPV